MKHDNKECMIATKIIVKRKRRGKGKHSSNNDNNNSSNSNSNKKKVSYSSNDKKNKSIQLEDTNTNILLKTQSLSGTIKCFQNQIRGSVGIRGDVKKQSASNQISIANKDYQLYYDKIQNILDPLYSDISRLIESYVINKGKEWIWKLACNFNLLLYGIGSKNKIIDGLIKYYLQDTYVLQIDGGIINSKDLNVKNDGIVRALLDRILKSILNNHELSYTLFSVVSYTKIVVGKLFIIY